MSPSAKTKSRIDQVEGELREALARLDATEQERDNLRALLLDGKNTTECLRRECQRLRAIIKSASSAMESCGEQPNDVEPTSECHPPPESADGATGLTEGSRGSGLWTGELHHREELSRPSPVISDVCIPLNSLTDIWPASLSSPQAASLQRSGNRGGILRFDQGQPSPLHDISDFGRVGAWAMKPVNTPPMAALDWAIVDMEEMCRNRASQDLTLLEFATPAFPHVSSLLNTESPSPAQSQKPITFAVATQIMSQMPVQGIIERLAAMWLICNLVRWRLCPTQESFAALPGFLRPTELQLTIPHPIWVDVIVWPAVRDRLIREFDYSRFEGFRHSLGSSISIGWTAGIAECLSLTDALDECSVSAEFELHLRDFSNWTVDAAFTREYQFLEGAIQVRP